MAASMTIANVSPKRGNSILVLLLLLVKAHRRAGVLAPKSWQH